MECQLYVRVLNCLVSGPDVGAVIHGHQLSTATVVEAAVTVGVPGTGYSLVAHSGTDIVDNS